MITTVLRLHLQKLVQHILGLLDFRLSPCTEYSKLSLGFIIYNSETSAIINQTPGNYPKESLPYLRPYLRRDKKCFVLIPFVFARYSSISNKIV